MPSDYSKHPISLQLVIPGNPVPKGRPRATKSGRVYTPKATRDYENLLRIEAQKAMGDFPALATPLCLVVRAYLPIPASWPVWKRQAAVDGILVPTTKPDDDNLRKTVDAFNGIIWRDDSQIIAASTVKRYSSKPRMVFIIKEVPGTLSAQSATKEQVESLLERVAG